MILGQYHSWIKILGLMALIALMGCATVADRLERGLKDGNYEEVIAEADDWMQEHQAGGDATGLRKRVVLLKASARLGQARELDTVKAYSAFRREHAAPIYKDLVAQAWELESQAWYRDRTQEQGNVEAHQYFRELYPQSSLASTSRHAESALALQKATRIGTVQAFQSYRAAYEGWEEAKEHVVASREAEVREALKSARATRTWLALEVFREKYAAWPEAAEAIKAARGVEFRLALEDANAQGTAAAFKRLRQDYASWPEAEASMASIRRQEVQHAFEEAVAAEGYGALRAFRASYESWDEAAPLMARAYEQEGRRALDEAVASQDPDEVVDFRARYPEQVWQQRGREAEASMVLEPVLEAMARRQSLSTEFVDAWVARNSALGHVRQAAGPREAALWSWARRQEQPTGYRLFAALYPDSTHSAEARRRERDLAWAAAQAAANKAQYLDFAQRYGDDERAPLAERRHYNLIKIERARQGYPRAQVTSRREGSRKQVDLYVDVRDCLGERISGLNQRDFEVFVNGEQVALEKFSGLEDAQPVDLVFQIDMSGSMGTEINAVQRAVIQFAEVFRFRGRRARLGLVTFSDELREVVPLTRDIGYFQRKVARLGETLGGGAAEDSTHALVKGADLLRASRAERVSVLLSDEHLQINAGGRSALGGGANADCKKARRVATCLSRCRRSFSCLNNCYMKLGKEARIAMQRCVRAYGHERCGRLVAWYDLIEGLNICGTPVHDHSLEMDMLVERLNSRRVRPYMLVPEGRFGFEALADQTQGQVLHVPEDGSDEAPYVEALMEISDQLSRQYVLSVPAAALQGGGQIDILTRPGHLWVELGQLPHKGALGLFADERADEDCPSFVMVSADAGVHVSERCGAAWRALDQEMGEGPFKAALKQGEAVMVLSAAGELYEVDAQGGQVTKVALDMARLADIALGAQDELFLIGQSEAGAPWSLMSLDFRGEAELAPLVAVVEGAPAPVPVIHPARSRKCAMVAHASMVCVEPEREAFTVNVAGISEEMFSRGLRVLPVPDRPGVFLGLVGDGRILRSFGDGARWVEVAPAVGQGRDLVFVPGQHAVACAASATAMLCSEDAGLTWFEVGRRFDEEDQSAMVSVGQRLYMAQNGQLQRLERVVNREIPSTTVYFATNARSPQANMLPFLQEVADAMRRDSSLVLRVEGHADHRGSTEYNEELAADRADSIIDIIAGAGIARPRLQSVSYGERRPVRSGTSGDALAVNRRVEIILMRPDIRLGGVQDPCREP